MGVSTSGGQLAKKVDGFARDLGSNRGPVTKTAVHVQSIIQGAATSKGVKPTTAPIRMKSLTDDMALVYGTGKSVLVDQGANPHLITPRGGRSRRRSTKAATGAALSSLFGGAGLDTLTGGALGGGAAAVAGHPIPYAMHPGSKRAAKHFWAAGREIAERTAPNVYMAAQVTVPLKKWFG